MPRNLSLINAFVSVQNYLVSLASLVFLALLTFLAFPSHAQSTFQRTYISGVSTWAYDVIQSNDSGYVVAGGLYPTLAPNMDIFVIKTSPQGDLLWNSKIASAENDVIYSVRQTADKGYLLGGHTINASSVADQFLAVSLDSVGNLMWFRRYGTSGYNISYEALPTADGEFVMTGYSGAFNDVYLLKIGYTLGNPLWGRIITQTAENGFYPAVELPQGGFAIAYTRQTTASDTDIGLMVTDSVGNTLWSKRYQAPQNTAAHDLVVMPDGGFAINCIAYGSFGHDSQLILRTDSLGTLVWANKYLSPFSDDLRSYQVKATADGGLVTCGSEASPSWGSGDGDLNLLKIDASGNVEWCNLFDSYSADAGYGITTTFDGGYAVAGTTFTTFNGELYFLKTDTAGTAICNASFATVNSISVPVLTFADTNSTVPFMVAQQVMAVAVTAGTSVTVLCTTGMEEHETGENVEIYPNPASDFITINASNNSFTEVKLELFNIYGQLIMTGCDESIKAKEWTRTVDVSSLPAGVYFVRIGERTFKLIIE